MTVITVYSACLNAKDSRDQCNVMGLVSGKLYFLNMCGGNTEYSDTCASFSTVVNLLVHQQLSGIALGAVSLYVCLSAICMITVQ